MAGNPLLSLMAPPRQAAAARRHRPRPENRPQEPAGWVADPRGFSVDEAAQPRRGGSGWRPGRTPSPMRWVQLAADHRQGEGSPQRISVEVITARCRWWSTPLARCEPADDRRGPCRASVSGVTEARQPHEREDTERSTTTEISTRNATTS